MKSVFRYVPQSVSFKFARAYGTAFLLLVTTTVFAQFGREQIVPSSSLTQAAVAQGRVIEPIVLTSVPSSQAPQLRANPRYKTSGKEFYVVFPSAVSSSTDLPVRRVYIAARSFARGKVSAMDGSWSKEFEVMPKSLTPVNLPPGSVLDRREIEAAYRRVYMIETEDDVSVYAFAPNKYSSDACLVLPRETLGKEYVIASARNALFYTWPATPNPNDPLPRSEFAVAAIEDGTEVIVNLTADSYTGRFQKGYYYKFTLNRGEVIQFAARDTGRKGLVGYWDKTSLSYIPKMAWIGKEDSTDCDLTGSRVLATKPVAVFSGHERASVPDDLEFAWQDHPTVSRDHLLEQMPPVEVWGKKFIVIAARQNEEANRPGGGDYVRVISRYDGTDVLVNGVKRYTLYEGKFAQFQSEDFSVIETSQPALVVRYFATAKEGLDTVMTMSTGDPDMMVVPPIENMSTFYSLPTTHFSTYFYDHYITLIIDTGAYQTTLLNNFQPDMTAFKGLPNVPYMYARFRTQYEGEQRVESTLPCYAETYGYGNVDSYSFSGGGDFKYIKGLSANDLNFGFVKLGDKRDSITTVLSTVTPSPLADTVTIFRYTWDSGDTSVFAILDTIKSPIKLAPGEKLSVSFSFKPRAKQVYSARLRVWSNNLNPVYIRVFGNSGTPCLRVEDNLIDFGRVRINRTVQDTFFYYSYREDSLVNPIVKLAFPEFSLTNTAFFTTPHDGPLEIKDRIYSHEVRFTPPARDFYRDSIDLYYSVADSEACDTTKVYLFGRGVYPAIEADSVLFSPIRFGTSAKQDLIIRNEGDDTTQILEVSIEPGGDNSEFKLTIPSFEFPKYIDTANSPLGQIPYQVEFTPRPQANPDKDGWREVRIKIVTNIGTYYTYARGRGVEPWFTAAPDTIDFGTITNPWLTGPNKFTKSFTIQNEGTMNGLLNAIAIPPHSPSDSNYFTLETTPPSPMFDTNAQATLDVSFHVKQMGSFFDSIVTSNDSRSQPVIYLKGSVEIDYDFADSVSFDTVVDCRPIDTIFYIRNPFWVPIAIKDTLLTGNPDGFRFYPNFSFQLPIDIPPDGLFYFSLRYEFPIDSTNGDQTLFLVITKPVYKNGILTDDLDTFSISLYRKTHILDLVASKLPYNPNALDAPFRLPIHIRGERLGKSELDNMTIKLLFSNEMVQPVGIDRTGSLTESATQVNWTWDEVTNTMSIPIRGARISTDASNNNLLFTLLGDTYLTVDTMIEIIPEIDYIDKPCAYRISRDSTTVIYANECGDRTIRDLLRTPVFSIGPAHPDPASLAETKMIFVPYLAPRSYITSWKLYDALGATIHVSDEIMIDKGTGKIRIAGEHVRISGLYFIEVTVRDPDTNAIGKYVTKFAVTN